MIDAYEIGIQLALQDDVSAGLEVINRGLAEVDRAIDVTSAKLVNLTAAAQAVTGPAAPGVASRPSAASSPNIQEGVEEPQANPVTTSGVGSAANASTSPSDIPERGSPDQTSPGSKRAIAPNASVEQTTASAVWPETAGTAPVARAEWEQTSAPTVVEVQHSVEPVAPPGPTHSVPSTDKVSSVGTAIPVSPAQMPLVSASKSVAPKRSADTGQTAPEKVLTASVAQIAPPARAYQSGDTTSPSPVRPGEQAIELAGRATAPWSGVETRVLPRRPESVSERPSAPQARQQDRSEALTGNVMLDGHQVGYWLAEQMAKEASRPPSGTSFFDPRQTPAWTASGSL